MLSAFPYNLWGGGGNPKKDSEQLVPNPYRWPLPGTHRSLAGSQTLRLSANSNICAKTQGGKPMGWRWPE